MLQWFLRFSEFTEYNESSAPFRENPIICIGAGVENIKIAVAL